MAANTAKVSALPILEPAPSNATVLTLEIFDKFNDNNDTMTEGTLGVNATHKLNFTDPTDTINLPAFGNRIGEFVTYENGTELPTQTNVSIPAIAYIVNTTCPTDPSRTGITHGAPPVIDLLANVSGTIKYHNSLPDIEPNDDGTYMLAFWSFIPVSEIRLPDDARLYHYSEETCFTESWGNNDIIFYNITFGLEAELEPPRPSANSTDSEPEIKTTLTEDERARATEIIANDPVSKQVLAGKNWTVQLIGPSTSAADDPEKGVMALIRLAETAWMEGEFVSPFSKETRWVKQWVRTMHIAVDLESGKVTGIDPGMARAPPDREAPVESEQILAAERIAQEHPLAAALGGDAVSHLTSVSNSSEYPEGLAIFSIRSAQGEILVAVDMREMAVVEKLSGRVGETE